MAACSTRLPSGKLSRTVLGPIDKVTATENGVTINFANMTLNLTKNELDNINENVKLVLPGKYVVNGKRLKGV